MDRNLTSQQYRPLPIVVNGRYRAHKITGVQRYAHEIVSRLDSVLDTVEPRRGRGAPGHLWEQAALPFLCGGRLLWNPSGSGPIQYSRQVVTIHDLFPVEHPEWYSQTYARWYRILLSQLVKRAVHLIAVSHYTKSRLVTVMGCDPARITVIYNGLTTGCSLRGQDDIYAAAAALALPTRRYVLTVSSLEPRKNLRTVLEAWSAASRNVPEDVWLVLAGPAADKSVYADQCIDTRVPRVFFTGYVPQEHLAGLYSGASLFLYPSLAEGFGIPVLEAMACGVRVITSNTSSLPEVGGDVVQYADPHDVRSIAKLIEETLNCGAGPDRPYEPSIRRARRFTWDDAASSTYAILERAASLSSVQPLLGVHETI